MGAVDEYQRRSRQSVFIEYVMLGPDVNCTQEHAHQLGALLQGRDVLVNLIPWNPILSPSIRWAGRRTKGQARGRLAHCQANRQRMGMQARMWAARHMPGERAERSARTSLVGSLHSAPSRTSRPHPRAPAARCRSFRAPAEGATAAFHRILRHEYGVNCTIRQEKGQDISGACGQLVLEHGGRAGGQSGCGGGKGSLTDVEDLLLPPAAPVATAR